MARRPRKTGKSEVSEAASCIKVRHGKVVDDAGYPDSAEIVAVL